MVFHMQKTKTIREGNFHFPKYSILVSQRSVNAIGKLEPIGKKNVIRYLSGLANTLKLSGAGYVLPIN